MNKEELRSDSRVVANLSYCLSSLLYTQPQIAIQIVNKKE